MRKKIVAKKKKIHNFNLRYRMILYYTVIIIYEIIISISI